MVDYFQSLICCSSECNRQDGECVDSKETTMFVVIKERTVFASSGLCDIDVFSITFGPK